MDIIKNFVEIYTISIRAMKKCRKKDCVSTSGDTSSDSDSENVKFGVLLDDLVHLDSERRNIERAFSSERESIERAFISARESIEWTFISERESIARAFNLEREVIEQAHMKKIASLKNESGTKTSWSFGFATKVGDDITAVPTLAQHMQTATIVALIVGVCYTALQVLVPSLAREMPMTGEEDIREWGTLPPPPRSIPVLNETQKQQLRKLLDEVAVVLVPQRDSGHPLIIAYLAGYPVALDGVLVLCPVWYSLRRAKVQRCVLDDEVTRCDMVVTKLDSYMKSLSSPSTNAVHVVYEGPDALPMEIVDLPSITAKDIVRYRQAVEVIRTFVSRRDLIIVTVCRLVEVNPSAQMCTQVFEEVLSEVRPDWAANHIAVNTYVHIAMQSMHKSEDFVNYFTEAIGRHEDTFFLFLNPGNLDLDSMSPAFKKSSFLAARGGGELQRFSDLAKLVARQLPLPVLSEITTHVGVKPLYAALAKQLNETRLEICINCTRP